MRLVGYARVSTSEQDTALQLDALGRAGVHVLFSENASGVGPRPELERVLTYVVAGDVFVVWKIDRIARSLGDFLNILGRLRGEGVALRSLTEPIDTSTPIGEFMLQVLGAVAQLERSMIRERVMAGQRAARERDVRWGKRRALSADRESEVVALYLSGNYTQAELAEKFEVGLGSVKCAIYRVTRPDAPYLTRVR